MVRAVGRVRTPWRVSPYYVAGRALGAGARFIRNNLGHIAAAGAAYIAGPRTKKGTVGKGITRQHDRQNVYNYRRMPKARRRKWKKFVKRVTAVTQRNQVSSHIIRNRSAAQEGVLNEQGIMCVLHAGASGDSALAPTWENTDFLQKCIAADQHFGGSTEKIQIQSLVTDLTVRNETTQLMEVDVYEGDFTKRSKSTYFSAEVNRAESETAVLTGAGVASQIELGKRGATPFNLPMIMSDAGWKIKGKKKYFLASGDVFTYQIRDPKNHVMEVADIYGTGLTKQYAIPGITKGLIFIYKCVDVTTDQKPKLRINATYSMTYTYEGADEKFDAIIN